MRLVFVIVVGLFVNKVIVQCVCVGGDRPLSLNPLFLGPLVWLAFFPPLTSCWSWPGHPPNLPARPPPSETCLIKSIAEWGI